MANETKILLPKEFDASKISMSEPKGPDNKAKTVYINHGGDKLIFQTPEMPMPFGLSKWDNEGKGPIKYSIDLSFKEKDSRPNVAKFFEMLEAMDKLAIDTAIQNKTTWFKGKGSKYSEEMIRNLYTPTIKYAKDKVTKEPTDAYPPTYKVVLPYNDAEKRVTSRVYNNKKETLDIMDMDANGSLVANTKGARATVIVQCAGIWISTTGFGISWKAIQIRLVPPTTIKEHAFIEDADQDVEESDIEDDDEAADKNGKSGGGGPAGQQQSSSHPRGGGGSTSVADRDMLEDDEDDELEPPKK